MFYRESVGSSSIYTRQGWPGDCLPLITEEYDISATLLPQTDDLKRLIWE